MLAKLKKVAMFLSSGDPDMYDGALFSYQGDFLDYHQLFLSKRAAASFGHYVDAQLRRLQNAIARDMLPQPSREEHILKSVNNALDDFNLRQRDEYKTGAKLYVDTAETP